ncbi:MAG: hypothetical protein IT557_16230 [Alphaproteobacteria bacterium]|nr:hypothetical protein [Alphaproteobacteria bacterium]
MTAAYYSLPELRRTPGSTTAEGIVFAIYYENPVTVPDRAFARAAEAWMAQATEWFPGANTVTYAVRTVADVVAAWATLRDVSLATANRVLCGNILSHASYGAYGGLELSPTDDARMICTADITLDWAAVSGLDRLNWASSAFLILNGCNTGVADPNRRMSLADMFARRQRVATLGMTGYSSFSERWSYYRRITARSRPISLWAYSRGRNSFFPGLGSDQRLEAAVSYPA